MPISFISNPASTVSRQSLSDATDEVRRSIAKISSGNRVFEAQEDAASLSIGKGLELDSVILKTAAINAQTGSSLMQVADGALGKVQEILDRMESITTQAMSGQLSNQERAFLDTEYQNMLAEVDRIVDTTEFNGVKILGGVNEVLVSSVGTSVDSDNGFVGYTFDSFVDPTDTFEISFVASTKTLTLASQNTGAYQTVHVDTPAAGYLTEYDFSNLGVSITLNDQFNDAVDMLYTGVTEEVSVVAGTTPTASVYEFQIGTGTSTNDRIQISAPVVNSAQLGLATTDISTIANATTAKSAIRSAVDQLSTFRSTLGASMNRMEIAAANIAVSYENTELARSALLDTDVAAEITTLTTQQVVIEASTSMLAQANTMPQTLLQLLGR